MNAGTSVERDFKKIKQEPQSIGSAVTVDEQFTVKFEDGLKEEPKDFDAFKTSSGLIVKNTEVLKLWKEKAKELYKRNKPKMGRPKSAVKFPCSKCTKKFASERCQVCNY